MNKDHFIYMPHAIARHEVDGKKGCSVNWGKWPTLIHAWWTYIFHRCGIAVWCMWMLLVLGCPNLSPVFVASSGGTLPRSLLDGWRTKRAMRSTRWGHISCMTQIRVRLKMTKVMNKILYWTWGPIPIPSNPKMPKVFAHCRSSKHCLDEDIANCWVES